MFEHPISQWWIHVTVITIVHILCVKYVWAKEKCPNSTPAIWNLHCLLGQLQWKSFATIQDTDEEAVFPYPIKQQVYNINGMNTSFAMGNIHSLLFPDINVILAVNDSSTLQMVNEIDNFDFKSNRTTDFRHHSKLFVTVKNENNLQNVLRAVQHLENVAAIVVKGVSWTESANIEQIYTLQGIAASRIFIPVRLPDKCSSSLLTWVFPNTQYGYNNRQLLVSTLPTDMGIRKKMVNGETVYSGFIIDIWHAVTRALNLSYVFTEPEDGEWGASKNGEWTGMIGQLIKRNIDIAVADLTVHYGRSQMIDYIEPSVLVDGMDIIYRIKADSTSSFFLIARPLQLDVYVIFISITAGLLLIFIIIDNHQYLFHVPIFKGVSTIFSRHLSTIGFEVVGSLLKQGFRAQIKTNTGKVLLSSFWILVVLITSLYCANFSASLTGQSGVSTLSSIDDLVDSDYTVGMFDAGIEYVMLQTSKRPEIQRLHDKMRQLSEHDSEIFMNNRTAHMIRVKKGGHAHILYKSEAAKFLSEDCDLALIGESISVAQEHISFGILNGSPLKNDIDKVMYKLKESGLLDIWWKKWTSRDKTTTSCGVAGRGVRTITLRDIGGSFLVACGGLGFSCLVLIVEICRHRLQRR